MWQFVRDCVILSRSGPAFTRFDTRPSPFAWLGQDGSTSQRRLNENKYTTFTLGTKHYISYLPERICCEGKQGKHERSVCSAALHVADTQGRRSSCNKMCDEAPASGHAWAALKRQALSTVSISAQSCAYILAKKMEPQTG